MCILLYKSDNKQDGFLPRIAKSEQRLNLSTSSDFMHCGSSETHNSPSFPDIFQSSLVDDAKVGETGGDSGMSAMEKRVAQ